jgi:hypothetical protein
MPQRRPCPKCRPLSMKVCDTCPEGLASPRWRDQMTAGNCIDVDAEYLEAGTPSGENRSSRPASTWNPADRVPGGRPDVAPGARVSAPRKKVCDD